MSEHFKRHKYGVSPTEDRTYKGIVYASKLEMNYRKKLDMLLLATNPTERVVGIREQVPYTVAINGQKICKYLLDFKVVYGDGRVEHIDCKGMKTDVYIIKKKLVEAIYKIKIIEVTKVK